MSSPPFNSQNNFPLYSTSPIIPQFSVNDSNELPIQFNINFYLEKIKPSAFTPFQRCDFACPYCINNIYPKDSKFLILQMSLEHSGFKFAENKINNDESRIISGVNTINGLHNFSKNVVVNNIYPNFNKINNVQILSETVTRENSGSKLLNKEANIPEINNENINNDKKKILFECSEENNSQPNLLKKFFKKKRLRKNNNQIILLSKFYKENKIWTKKQIKEISEKIGLKENKIYKWLWDQKNKEYKASKFIINKNENASKIIE